MRTTFQRNKITVAIQSVPANIWTEHKTHTQEAIETMKAHNHITASELTAPAHESGLAVGIGASFELDEIEATGEISGVTGRAASAVIVLTIGKRLVEARELCGFSQTEAARLLEVPLRVLLVHERATDRTSASLSFLQRAATLYQVSMDFLFGQTDDFEVGARMHLEREASRWLFEKWEAARLADMEELLKLHNRVEAFHKVVAGMEQHAESIATAFTRWIELNPEFEDLRGGVRLEKSVTDFVESTKAARLVLTRFRAKIAAYPAPVADDVEVSQ